MAIDERLRHTIYQRLRDTLGEDVAVALMDHIPWMTPATAEQVDRLAAEMDRRFTEMDRRLTGRIDGLHRTVIVAAVSVVLGVAALNFAAIQIVTG